jgi:hypothetical protein
MFKSRAPGPRHHDETRRPHRDLEVPERHLRPERQRQPRRPADAPTRHEPLGHREAERQIRQRVIERLVAGVARLEPAERKGQGRHRAAPRRDPQHARIGVRRRRQRDVMQPHREPVRRRHAQNAVRHEVRRIERRRVALGHQRRAQAEPIAPVRQRPRPQRHRRHRGQPGDRDPHAKTRDGGAEQGTHHQAISGTSSLVGTEKVGDRVITPRLPCQGEPGTTLPSRS